MCLGIPGKIVSVYREHDLLMAKIDFGGVVKAACLETLPDSAVGDYVLVHVGFALARINEAEARQIFAFLEGTNELSEISDPAGAATQNQDGEEFVA
jgi:hydrogenase expression/formation protein HypC